MRSVVYLSLTLCIFSSYSEAFSQRAELDPGYYLVVGAYAPSRENVAQNYADVLNRRGIKASYGYNSSRKFFFVYLSYFTTLKESLMEMQRVRRQREFSDAWVRVVPGDIASAKLVNALKPITQTDTPQKTNEDKREPLQTEQVTPVTVADTASKISTSEVKVEDNPPIQQFDPMTLGNTEVFLSLYNGRNNRIVEGNIKVIDTDRARLMTEVKGNEYLNLPDPKSKSGQLTLICEAFGYRKTQQEINYPLPLADTVKESIDLMGTTFVINFDLVRYHKGDIATLYNVYFYNDAAVMLPDSKYELESLLQMMQENPRYRIRLHGHTNGNYHGKIITIGESKNFFSLDGSANMVGSAKELSEQRALVIKEYLISNGIDGSRIETKAWGGKRPLYDKHSVNAKRNVRVEVEILSE